MKQWIRQVYERGINTISMHLDNPYTGEQRLGQLSNGKYILPANPTMRLI